MKSVLYCSLLFTIMLGGLYSVASWYAVSQNGSDAILRDIAEPALFVYAIVSVTICFYIIAGAIRVFARKQYAEKKFLKAKLVLIMTSLPLMTALLLLGGYFRGRGMTAIASRGNALVTAISQFQVRNGRLPKQLDEMVPTIIAGIPSTGCSAYPRYIYKSFEDNRRCYGNSWIIYVPVSSNAQSRYDLAFFPLQNYPETRVGRYMTKTGLWAVMRLDFIGRKE